MHRRVLRCIAKSTLYSGFSSSASCNRYASTSTRTSWPRKARTGDGGDGTQSKPRRAQPHSAPTSDTAFTVPGTRYQPIGRVDVSLLGDSSACDDSLALDEQERRPLDIDHAQKRIPSQAKQAFDASIPEDDLEELLLDDRSAFSSVTLGTFVELRRSFEPVYGVIIHQLPGSKLQYVLTVSGTVYTTLSTDTYFAIPNVISPENARRCGTHEETQDLSELAARTQAIKRLRRLITETQIEYARISNKMANVYQKFKAEDPNEWSQVTTGDVVQFVVRSRTSTIPPTTVLAVHQHLMARSDRFVAIASDFLATQRFRVRPQRHVDDIQVVEELIAKHDRSLQSFVQKAQWVLSKIREQDSATWHHSPAIRPYADVSFAPGEMQIVRFLQATATSRRYNQRNPYIVSASTIMRLVEDPGVQITEEQVANFLMKLGLCTTWDDLISRDKDFMLESPPGSTEDTLGPAAQSASNILRDLGPQDYYPDDIVSSVRHDFGDLPVYVVDDAGAEELDDGLSIEPDPSSLGDYWIHVHIADPTSILPPTHDIARSALRSAQTFYLPHATIPMLPQTPELGSASLGSKAHRGLPENVMSFSFQIDDRGNIAQYKVRPGLVRKIHLLRYDDVDAALGIAKKHLLRPFDNASPSRTPLPLTATQTRDFKLLIPMIQRLARRRNELGAITTNFHNLDISINPRTLPMLPSNVDHPYICTGFPDITYQVTSLVIMEYGARQIVAECMKATSRVASMFMRDHGLPGIRRAVEPLISPSEEALADVMALRDEKGVIMDFSGFLQTGVAFGSASYTCELRGHHQLGIPDGEGYVHCTSPLRRVVDMLAHWQLKHYFASPSSPPLFSQEWMADCAREISNKFRVGKRIDTMCQEFWALKHIQRWMQHPEAHVGLEDPLESLMALPMAPPRLNLDNTHNSMCNIPALGLRGTLTSPRSLDLKLGVPVHVKIREIKFGFAPRLFVVPA